mgnify:CR=1 FL=1
MDERDLDMIEEEVVEEEIEDIDDDEEIPEGIETTLPADQMIENDIVKIFVANMVLI